MNNLFNTGFVISVLTSELSAIQVNMELIYQQEQVYKSNEKVLLRVKELKYLCLGYMVSVKKAIKLESMTIEVKQSRRIFYALKTRIDRVILPKSYFKFKVPDTEKITVQDIDILENMIACQEG